MSNKMKWKKLGRIYSSNSSVSWRNTHATIPIVDQIDKHHFKIYFTPRDEKNRSHVAWIIIDMRDPLKIQEISEEPVLEPGPIGAFDDSGAMANCLINFGDKKYLYYQGCNLGVTVPFRNSIGLAVSIDGGNTFKKLGGGPIIDRTYKEPHFTATPCVLIDGKIFKCWYLSCVRWEMVEGKPKHYYHIKYAESDDGIIWRRDGVVAIDFKDSDEYAIGVPRVIKEDGIYKMWYCYRGHRYRIGYAESEDGISWIRLDERIDFSVSESGWDSEMIEYPFIFDYDGSRYMLYNGNSYGKTGFGIARLDE